MDTIRNHFDQLAQIELKQMMSAAKRKYDKDPTKFPPWVTDDLCQQLVDRWNSDAVKAKSATNRRNRLAEQVPEEGSHTHNTGS